MSLYLVGIINGFIICSFGYMGYKGYEIYINQLLYKQDFNEMKEYIEKFMSDEIETYFEEN